MLVDETDPGEEPSAVVLLEHGVRDGRTTATGRPHIVSEKLQFAAIGRDGGVLDAGIAPHLNLRPARPEEAALLDDLATETWLHGDIERAAIEFATAELARAHVAEVKARRLPEIEKVEREVHARLKKEINHWDARAFELKEQERAGKKTRLSSQNAARRAEDLAERLKRRTALLEQEKFISSRPPRVRGGMLVIPRGLIEARAREQAGVVSVSTGFSDDPVARRKIELAAMEAVMVTERALGNTAADVSAGKVGYDIVSFDPVTRALRFIEVKGRIGGADTVMITRQEIITSLHEPEKFILALVEVNDGVAGEPHYVRGALDAREPPFDQDAIQFNLKRLLERADVPE